MNASQPYVKLWHQQESATGSQFLSQALQVWELLSPNTVSSFSAFLWFPTQMTKDDAHRFWVDNTQAQANGPQLTGVSQLQLWIPKRKQMRAQPRSAVHPCFSLWPLMGNMATCLLGTNMATIAHHAGEQGVKLRERGTCKAQRKGNVRDWADSPTRSF